MLAIPLDDKFRMTRLNYWWFVFAMFLTSFIIGYQTAYHEDSDEIITMLNGAGALYMWVVGAMRLRESNRSAWPAFFAPTLIGLIWIGCLADKETIT